MDLFKTAQRIPPRRIPVVRRYESLPAQMGAPVAVVAPRLPGPASALIGLLALALVIGAIGQMSDSEPAPGSAPGTRSPGSAAPAAAPSFRVIPPADLGGGGGGGGGGGFGGPAAGPLIREKAPVNVVSSLRKIVFTLKKDPSTRANMTDRVALFGKYFNSLTPSDRIALFGTLDFRQVEHAIRVQGEKGPMALDRCLAQLQLILF